MTKAKTKPEVEKHTKTIVEETSTKKKKSSKINPDNVEDKKKKSKNVAAPVVDELPINSAPVKAKKETTKKEATKKEATKKEKKEVVLLADRNGISLAPVRIRNILLNVVFNNRAVLAESELKAHEEELLNESNLKNGYESFHKFSEQTQAYIKELRRDYLNLKMTQYERKKISELNPKQEKGSVKQPLPENVANLLNERRQRLKTNSEASFRDLYLQFDKNFYNDFNEERRINNLTGTDAFSFYKSLIAKDKIRLNEESRVRLTCFFELILRHFVAQANLSCVLNKNKTVNLGNMNSDDASVSSNYLSTVVENLGAWKSVLDWEFNGKKQQLEELKNNQTDSAAKKLVMPKFVNYNKVNPNNKYKFKSYIVDVCRDVSRQLSNAPPKCKYPEGLSKQDISNALRCLNVSNDFKEFCTQVLLELIYNLGSVLRILLKTRRDRTVEKNLVDAVINTYHISFNETHNLKKTHASLDKMVSTFNKAQDNQKKERAANPNKKNNLVGRGRKSAVST